MPRGQYVVIQSFMVEDLKLKGNELIVYAVVFGFTQDGNHWYYGTRGYLASWCGASKGTVSNCLSSLVKKGYLERVEEMDRGVMRVKYRASLKLVPPTKNYEGGTGNYGTPLPKIRSVNNKDDNIDKRVYFEKKTENPCPNCGDEMQETDSGILHCFTCGEER